MNEFQLCRSFHTVSQYEKFEMKFLGCEILGTAAKTLTPLTNFPRAEAANKQTSIQKGSSPSEFTRPEIEIH